MTLFLTKSSEVDTKEQSCFTVSSCLQTSECTLKVLIDDIQLEALLDSGANHSIVGPTLLNLVPKLKEDLKEVAEEVSARTVNGNSVVYKYEINLNIKLEDVSYEVHAYFSPTLPYHMILGYDFLKEARLTINFGELIVQPQKTYVVSAATDITMDPCSETITWVKLTGRVVPGLAILTAHDKITRLGFSAAHSLITLDDQNPWVPVRLLNPYPTTKTVTKGTKIAIAERLTKADHIAELSPINMKTSNAAVRSHQKVRFHPPDDFCALFDLTSSTFNAQQKQELLCLLWEYADIFLKRGDKLGCTDILEFEVNLKDDAQPFKAAPYRSNPKLRKEISRQVKEMLEDDIIRPSTSQYGSPVLLVCN